MIGRFPSLHLPTFGPVHIVVAVAALLLALFAYAAAQTWAQTYQTEQERYALEVEVAGLRQQRAELEGLRAYLSSEEYLEASARERLGLVRPGEIAVEIEAPEEPERPRDPERRWWETLFGR